MLRTLYNFLANLVCEVDWRAAIAIVVLGVMPSDEAGDISQRQGGQVELAAPVAFGLPQGLS